MTRSRRKQRGESRRLVFISHAGTDTWIAKRMAEQIGALNVDIFLDEAHISIGEDFEDRLLKELGASDELVVLLTPSSLTRPYVWAEIGAAWFKRIVIVGVVYGLTIEELQKRPEVPLIIKRRELITLNEFDKYLGALKRRVS